MLLEKNMNTSHPSSPPHTDTYFSISLIMSKLGFWQCFERVFDAATEPLKGHPRSDSNQSSPSTCDIYPWISLSARMQPQQDPYSLEKTLSAFSWVNTSAKKGGKRHGMKTWSHWKPLPCCSTGSDFSLCPSFGDFCRITGTHREYLAQLHRGRARKFLSSVSADFLLLRICQPNSFILMSTTAVSPQFPIKERISRILPEELRAPLFFLPQWRVIFSCRGSCWMERLVGAWRWKHWWD